MKLVHVCVQLLSASRTFFFENATVKRPGLAGLVPAVMFKGTDTGVSQLLVSTQGK